MPSTDTDGVGHGVQLFIGIGQHVAHEHAPIGCIHVINIDRHNLCNLGLS